MKHNRIRTVLAFVAAAFAASAVSSAHAQSGPVVLKAVSGWDKSLVFVDKYMDWIKRVNEKGAGKVRIDYIGGPEVFPAFEQLEPLKRGVFFTVVTSSAYMNALPELNATWLGFGASPAAAGFGSSRYTTVCSSITSPPDWLVVVWRNTRNTSWPVEPVFACTDTTSERFASLSPTRSGARNSNLLPAHMRRGRATGGRKSPRFG